MTCAEKAGDLRQAIERSLLPLLNRDYWLLDVPYHANIGDTLIWQGESDFLSKMSCRCRGQYALSTFTFPKIQKSDLILFHGGGNFGDLWPECHDFKMKVVEAYPENEFVFFPQTVYFGREENLRRTVRALDGVKCTICARDRTSYEFLKRHFRNRILLVPDMAFCMNMSRWAFRGQTEDRPLLVLREDKEIRPSPALERLRTSGAYDVSDWPTMTAQTSVERWRDRLRDGGALCRLLYDPYMRQVYRPYLIRSGVDLIGPRATVVTTRLHACILAVLLGKGEIITLDNSYGKNRSFVDTWLADCDSVRLEPDETDEDWRK